MTKTRTEPKSKFSLRPISLTFSFSSQSPCRVSVPMQLVDEVPWHALPDEGVHAAVGQVRAVVVQGVERHVAQAGDANPSTLDRYEKLIFMGLFSYIEKISYLNDRRAAVVFYPVHSSKHEELAVLKKHKITALRNKPSERPI